MFGQFLRPITNHLVVVWDASRVHDLCGTGLVCIFWHVKILKGTVVGPHVLDMLVDSLCRNPGLEKLSRIRF